MLRYASAKNDLQMFLQVRVVTSSIVTDIVFIYLQFTYRVGRRIGEMVTVLAYRKTKVCE